MTGSSSRIEHLHVEIERQIEVVAELICENKSAVKAQRLLQDLTEQLAAEEVRLARYEELSALFGLCTKCRD